MEKENEKDIEKVINQSSEANERGHSPLSMPPPSETDGRDMCQGDTYSLDTFLEDNAPWWRATEIEDLPTIPDWVYGRLPDFLKQVIAEARLEAGKRRQRDVVLMGALTTLSATFFNVSGKYNDKRHWPNLYFYLVAPFAAGKNTQLEACRELVKAFSEDTADSPIADCFVLSGNITGSAMLEWLQENNGIGLIFSTEADVLTQSMKGEFAGTMSSTLRDAFGNSRVDHARRKNNKERIIIETPRLSVLLAGTPGSVPRFFGTENVENGLFSRFAFYCMPGERKVADDLFRDSRGESKEERFMKIGKQYRHLWEAGLSTETLVDLQDWQQADFPKRLQQLTDKAIMKMGEDVGKGLAFRYGELCWRIANALTAARQFTNPSTDIVVSNEDYLAAWAISLVLWHHSIFVLHHYAVATTAAETGAYGRPGPEDMLFQMADTFTAEDWLTSTAKNDITRRTAFRYLHRLEEQQAIRHTGKGQYAKSPPPGP